MAEVSRDTFKTNTTTLYPDNTSGQISPADLRAQMDDIADSTSFKGIGKTSAPGVTDDGAGTGGNGAFNIGDIWVDETNNIAYISADDSTGAAVWLELSNTGNPIINGSPVANQVAFWSSAQEVSGDAGLTYLNGLLTVSGLTPIYEIIESDASADNQRWWTWGEGEELRILAVTDAGATSGNYAAFTRTGNEVDSLDFTISNTVRTSVVPNGLNFSNATSTIQTVDAFSLQLGVQSEGRVFLPSGNPKLIIQGSAGDGTLETALDVGDSNLTTGAARVAVGTARSGDGEARLDLISDSAVHLTYGFRLNRESGTNAITTLSHRGTAAMQFNNEDSGSFQFQFGGTDALVISTTEITTDLPFKGLRGVNSQVGTSYTAALSDQNGIITMNNAAANTVFIEIESTVAYPDGFVFEVIQLGAGVTRVEVVDFVAINGAVGSPATFGADIQNQYGVAYLRKVGPDNWIIDGDIGPIGL